MKSMVVFLALASVACASWLPLAQPPHTPALVLDARGRPLDTAEVINARAFHLQAKVLDGHYGLGYGYQAPLWGGHYLGKRSLGHYAAHTVHAAHAVPAAVSHQSRVDVISSPAVVSHAVAAPVVAHAVHAAPAVAVAPAAVSHQSRVDVHTSPAVVSHAAVAAVPVASHAAVTGLGYGAGLYNNGYNYGYAGLDNYGYAAPHSHGYYNNLAHAW